MADRFLEFISVLTKRNGEGRQLKAVKWKCAFGLTVKRQVETDMSYNHCFLHLISSLVLLLVY
jgi:hypothetical protein